MIMMKYLKWFFDSGELQTIQHSFQLLYLYWILNGNIYWNWSFWKHTISLQNIKIFKIKKSRAKTRWVHFITWFLWKFYFYRTGCITGIHWKNTQATLHPFVACVQSNDNLKVISMCIIGDCLTHGTVVVASFQRLVILYLTSQYPDIKKKKYFSAIKFMPQ